MEILLAVSYTHLVINELLDNSIRDIGCDRAFIMEGHNGKANASGLGFYYIDTVSYTHLDVYKRQVVIESQDVE